MTPLSVVTLGQVAARLSMPAVPVTGAGVEFIPENRAAPACGYGGVEAPSQRVVVEPLAALSI